MTSLPVFCSDESLILSVEPGDFVRAIVRVPWAPGSAVFNWLIAEMSDARPADWMEELRDPAVQRAIHGVLLARAKRDRDGLSGEEHNVTWRWIQEQRAAAA